MRPGGFKCVSRSHNYTLSKKFDPRPFDSRVINITILQFFPEKAEKRGSDTEIIIIIIISHGKLVYVPKAVMGDLEQYYHLMVLQDSLSTDKHSFKIRKRMDFDIREVIIYNIWSFCGTMTT